ncbi:hypothetical protein JIQ42_01141 [Leishmania sp. Namibia]|uniref:hypothetical protein n=1 Tax=Leishmania sp. Namibia TaxID=2802991 RepID=UPI001B411133|nr:hypothetical protein JIQ42_01141 [Leishmania sp. Namibia]
MVRPDSPTALRQGGASSAASGEHAPPLRISCHIDENTSVVVLVTEVLKRSIPLGLAAVAQNSINLVMVAMVGKMVGDEELGATVLANSILNATAFSVSTGLCGALETVLSQSYGRDQTSKQYGVYVQRMALILLIVATCVGPVIAFSDSLLISIGQNGHVANFTGQFCRISLFGVYSLMLLEMMRRYFACQHLNAQLSVNLIAGAGSFPFVLWVCIKVFRFPGAAVAWSLLMGCMPASLFVYLFVTGKYKKTWGGWEPAALKNWGPLLKLALPSMAMMLSEWMSQEINIIIAGYAPIDELDAFSILHQFSAILWGMTSGVFIEAAVLVGNALGQRKPLLARRCAQVCLGLTLTFVVMNLSTVLLLRHWIPAVFTDNTNVHLLFRKMLKYYVIYHLFDCIQSCMMGVLRGCGLQSVGAISIALVYSIIGVPLGVVVFFKTSMGVNALWLGPCIGLSLVGFPLYCYLFVYYIQWDKLQPLTDEIPSFNTSMNERSVRAYTDTPSPSLASSDSELARFEGEDLHSEGGPARRYIVPLSGASGRGSLPDSGRHTPISITSTSRVLRSPSTTSLNAFCIPQRTILSAPPFFASSASLSEIQPPLPLVGSLNEEHDAAAASRTSGPRDRQCRHMPSSWSNRSRDGNDNT